MSAKRNTAPIIQVGDTVKIIRLSAKDQEMFGHMIGKYGTVDCIAEPFKNAVNVIEVEVDGYGFFACSARELEVVL
jgi:hypothetical protein